MKQMVMRMCVLLAVAGMLGGCTRALMDSPVAGDKIYVEPGYKQQLARLKLTEVAVMPYFTKPFITVAKDESGRQFAVVFRSETQADQVRLPLSHTEMLSRVHAAGRSTEGAAVSNLHLFEINKRLVWCFTDGQGTLYWELGGQTVKDPFTSSTSKMG